MSYSQMGFLIKILCRYNEKNIYIFSTLVFINKIVFAFRDYILKDFFRYTKKTLELKIVTYGINITKT